MEILIIPQSRGEILETFFVGGDVGGGGGGPTPPPPPALIRPRVKLEFPALNVNSGEERVKTAVLAG